MTAAISKPPYKYTGLSGSANTIACSGGTVKLPVEGSYSRYPDAAWWESHSRVTLGDIHLRRQFLRSHRACSLIALYRPSLSPIAAEARCVPYRDRPEFCR